VGQNRPQFRAATCEDPGQVKDLVEKLEKYQSPDSDDSDYVRLELVKWVLIHCLLIDIWNLNIFIISGTYLH